MSEPPPSRLIAPAPPGHRRVEAEEDPTLNRKHVTTACATCKQKKLKCRGGPPCNFCIGNGIQCMVDGTRDMRRKLTMKRKMEQLDESQKTLVQLIETLRDDGTERSEQLLSLIRSKASMNAIQDFLKGQFSWSEMQNSPELKEAQREVLEHQAYQAGHRQSSRRMLGPNRMADTPIYRLPAKPWTTVTDDDELVSHLTSLWLTWSNSFFHWVHQDTFVRDMQAGNLSCQFCSPFLVNAILALASCQCDYDEVFVTPGDMATRGIRFCDEAKRLLDAQEGRVDLPTVQGLGIMGVCLSILGKDRQGWQYVGMANQAADVYASALHHRQRDGLSADQHVDEEAIDHALWGMFNFVSTSSLCVLQHSRVAVPRRPRPIPSHGASQKGWFAYPKEMDPVTSHESCVFASWCDLCSIVNELVNTALFPNNEPAPSQLPAVIQSFHERLQSWQAKLPPCLQIQSDSVPHIFQLHMHYHTVIIQMYGLLMRTVEENEGAEGCPTDLARARNISLSSALQVASLAQSHRAAWGVQRMCETTVQWLSVSLSTLLERLDDPVYATAFTELASIMRTCARRWMMAKGALRMVQTTARALGRALSAEIETQFAQFEADGWEAKDRRHFSSLYPNFAVVLRPKGDLNAEEVLERCLEQLTLEDSESPETHGATLAGSTVSD